MKFGSQLPATSDQIYITSSMCNEHSIISWTKEYHMQKLLFSSDTDSGTVTFYDVANEERPIAKIQVGNGPRGAVRFTKDGRGFVTNHAGNTVSEIDVFALNEVAKITKVLAALHTCQMEQPHLLA
jgi:hypothetical protein